MTAFEQVGMGLRGDRRGQSVWIGAVLLLFALSIVFTVYQASVVPDQTARVEADHAVAVQADMQSVRSRVSLLGARGGSLSVAFDLGPDYPPRLFALSPPAPAGSLRTTTAGNLTVTVGAAAVNLSRTCGYGGDARVPTRSLAYSVDYNRYRAGTVVYDHSAVYRLRNGSAILLDDQQSLVTGETIGLAPLATRYQEAGTGTVSIRLVGGPVDRRTLDAGPNETVQVAFPTRLPATKWAELLVDQSRVRDVRQVAPRRVAVVLEPGHTYTLTCYGVGVGQAPPSGAAPLGGVFEGPTGTPTPTPTPGPVGDHPPNATIENVTLTRSKSGKTRETLVNVSWAATDPDGDLESVTVRVTNTDTQTAESRTVSVSGDSASATFSFAFPGAKKNDQFRVTVLMTDSRGNADEATLTKG